MEINKQEDEKVEEGELLEKEGTADDMEIDNKQEDEKVEELLENVPLGPGYMGWNLNDEEKDSPPDMDFKDKIAELKDGYDEMKRQFEKLKVEVNKNEKKLKSEIKVMKDDYIQYMVDLKTETVARNKAETIAKVLKDTIDAKKDLEVEEMNAKMEIDDTDESVDTDGGEWKQQSVMRCYEVP